MIWPVVFIAAVAAIIIFLMSPPPQPRVHIDWHSQQTCVFTPEEFGGKVGNVCSRLDPNTHWALRQRI